MDCDKATGARGASFEDILIEGLGRLLEIGHFLRRDRRIAALIHEGLDPLSALLNRGGSPLLHPPEILQMLLPGEPRTIDGLVSASIARRASGDRVAGMIQSALPLVLLDQMLHGHFDSLRQAGSRHVAIGALPGEKLIRELPRLFAECVVLVVVDFPQIDSANLSKKCPHGAGGSCSRTKGSHG